MQKQKKNNEILEVATAAAVLGIVVWGATYITKLVTYNLFYKGMVKETIREENVSK